MTPLSWVAVGLFALFTAISVLVLVIEIRSPGPRHGARLGWLVFDVVFGVAALTLVLAQVDLALWAALAVYVVRRVVEERSRRSASTAG